MGKLDPELRERIHSLKRETLPKLSVVLGRMEDKVSLGRLYESVKHQPGIGSFAEFQQLVTLLQDLRQAETPAGKEAILDQCVVLMARAIEGASADGNSDSRQGS